MSFRATSILSSWLSIRTSRADTFPRVVRRGGAFAIGEWYAAIKEPGRGVNCSPRLNSYGVCQEVGVAEPPPTWKTETMPSMA